MELKVYSSVCGELPGIIQRKEARCFVPLEQAVELQRENAELAAWREKAFLAHPNIDLDMESIEE